MHTFNTSLRRALRLVGDYLLTIILSLGTLAIFTMLHVHPDWFAFTIGNDIFAFLWWSGLITIAALAVCFWFFDTAHRQLHIEQEREQEAFHERLVADKAARREQSAHIDQAC